MPPRSRRRAVPGKPAGRPGTSRTTRRRRRRGQGRRGRPEGRSRRAGRRLPRTAVWLSRDVDVPGRWNVRWLFRAASRICSEQLRGSARGRLLQVEQVPLGGQPAGVPGQPAVLADDTVAGHDHAQRIAPDGGADFLGQYLAAQFRGEVAVADRLPVSDAADQVPDAMLEFVTAGIQRQLEALPGAGEVLGELAPGLRQAGRCKGAEGGGVGPVPVVREVQSGELAVIGDESKLADRRADGGMQGWHSSSLQFPGSLLSRRPGLLERAAAAHDLMYAPDPSSYEISTIGGNLATNAGGLRCVKYGVTRDAVLGL